MICLISFSKFSNILPAFTCASAIDNLVYLGVSNLSYLWLKILRLEIVRSQTLNSRFKSEGSPSPSNVLYFPSEKL